jgi:hypothetical protein
MISEDPTVQIQIFGKNQVTGDFNRGPRCFFRALSQNSFIGFQQKGTKIVSENIQPSKDCSHTGWIVRILHPKPEAFRISPVQFSLNQRRYGNAKNGQALNIRTDNTSILQIGISYLDIGQIHVIEASFVKVNAMEGGA